MNDFFFSFDLDNSSINYGEFISRIKNHPNNHALKHLNRSLRDSKNKVFKVTGNTSKDSLDAVIKNIGTGNISSLKLFVSEDFNQSVPYSFGIDITLIEGIVKFQGYWTDYKDIRFREVIECFLMPIYRYNLQSRTIIDNLPGWQSHHYDKEALPSDFEEAAYSFSKLGGHAYSNLVEKELDNWKNRLDSE